MEELQKVHTQKLSHDEIEALYQLVNTGRDYYIDPNSPQFADKIIELWFETQGYDFWSNPYEVTELSIGKDGSMEFKYVESQSPPP